MVPFCKHMWHFADMKSIREKQSLTVSTFMDTHTHVHTRALEVHLDRQGSAVRGICLFQFELRNCKCVRSLSYGSLCTSHLVQTDGDSVPILRSGGSPWFSIELLPSSSFLQLVADDTSGEQAGDVSHITPPLYSLRGANIPLQLRNCVSSSGERRHHFFV